MNINENNNTNVALPFLRSCLYNLLSQGFLYPQDALLKLGEEQKLWVKISAQSKNFLSSEFLDKYIQSVLNTLSNTKLDNLRSAYEYIFGHIVGGNCSPYETNYNNAHIFMQAQQLGDISAFYRAFSLGISDSIKERLDHIAIELEFMHFLTYKEMYALEHHSEDKIQICIDAQRKFLKEHLGRWSPLFARLLRRTAVSSTQKGAIFYGELASLLEEFLVIECRFLNLSPLIFEEKNMHFETIGLDAEECAGCGNDNILVP